MKLRTDKCLSDELRTNDYEEENQAEENLESNDKIIYFQTNKYYMQDHKSCWLISEIL